MSMFPKRPRKPTRAEQLAGLADALAIEVRRAIDGSAAVQAVMLQLGMLDVVAEVTSTIELGYRPQGARDPLTEQRRDREWLEEMGIRFDGEGR